MSHNPFAPIYLRVKLAAALSRAAYGQGCVDFVRACPERFIDPSADDVAAEWQRFRDAHLADAIGWASI